MPNIRQNQLTAENRQKNLIHIHLLRSPPINQSPRLLNLPGSLLTMQATRQLSRPSSLNRSTGLSLAQLLPNKMLALGHNSPILFSLLITRKLPGNPPLGELALATGPDLLNTLHGVNGGRDQVAVVLDGGIALLRKLRQYQRRVHDHLLASAGAVCLGPFQLAGLALHLEVLMAFGAAEAERPRVISVLFVRLAAVFGYNLGGSISPNECYPLARVRWARLGWGGLLAIQIPDKTVCLLLTQKWHVSTLSKLVSNNRE